MDILLRLDDQCILFLLNLLLRHLSAHQIGLGRNLFLFGNGLWLGIVACIAVTMFIIVELLVADLNAWCLIDTLKGVKSVGGFDGSAISRIEFFILSINGLIGLLFLTSFEIVNSINWDLFFMLLAKISNGRVLLVGLLGDSWSPVCCLPCHPFMKWLTLILPFLEFAL